MSGSRRLVRERRHDLEERQELHRHVIDEPDAVVRTVERAPGGMHAERFDLEDHRLPVALPNAVCCGGVHGQVHLLTRSRLQTL